MVGEFPDLQGVMGRRYAELANEDPDVAIALEQHYQPRGAHDAVPSSELASVIGIADRLDTIVGCFAVGLAPTGSADPYGLRRAALGVLRILLERTWTVDLKRLVQTARDQLAGKVDVSDEVVSNVMEFLRGRFRGLLTDAFSLSADCVDAALVVGFRDPRDARARAVAVSSLRTREDFEPLASAFKRIANILKGQSTGTQPRPELFTEGKEGELWSAYEEVRGKVDGCLAEHNYADAMGILVELKAPVDAFFETVLVMDDDEKIRSNRLALLSCINDTFSQIADFRQLVV